MTPKMTDKERILMNLVGDLISAQIMRFITDGQNERHGPLDYDLKIKSGLRKDHIKKGDLVYCTTSGRFNAHPWVVAWVEEVTNPNGGELLLREIGSNRLCKMGNEGFYVLDFSARPVQYYLEGERHKLYHKIRKAFERHGDYSHVFGGMAFDDENSIVTVTVRQRHGFDTVPYDIQLKLPKWGKRVSIKKLAEMMEAEGWNKREFDKKVKETA